MEEQIEYEIQKLSKKVSKVLQLNSELYHLNASKGELREELQQLEQLLFVKTLNQKSEQLEQEKKLVLSQRVESERQTKEVEHLKQLLEEKSRQSELLQQQVNQLERFQKVRKNNFKSSIKNKVNYH